MRSASNLQYGEAELSNPPRIKGFKELMRHAFPYISAIALQVDKGLIVATKQTMSMNSLDKKRQCLISISHKLCYAEGVFTSS